MSVDLRVRWYEARLYLPGSSYEERSQFYAGTNILIDGDTAKGSMALSKEDMRRSDLRELCLKLHGYGYRRLEIERARGHVLPFGTIISENEFSATWELEFLKLPFIR